MITHIIVLFNTNGLLNKILKLKMQQLYQNIQLKNLIYLFLIIKFIRLQSCNIIQY